MTEYRKGIKTTRKKLNQELMKIYQEKGVNPAGGCLPTFGSVSNHAGSYYTIRKPLTYMLGWSKEMIGNIIVKIMEIKPDFFSGNQYSFIDQFESVKANPAAVADLFEKNIYYEINLVDAINTIPNLLEEGIEKSALISWVYLILVWKPNLRFESYNAKPGLQVFSPWFWLYLAGCHYLSVIKIINKTYGTEFKFQVEQTNKTMMIFALL